MLPSMSLPQGSGLDPWSLGRWLWSNTIALWDSSITLFEQLYHLTTTATTVGLAATVALSDLCTPEYVRHALRFDTSLAITFDPNSVSTNLVANASFPASREYASGVVDYCNITFAYSHNDLVDDRVQVQYWVPAPTSFRNRYLSTGGFGYRISSGDQMLPLGPLYGAVSGKTDAGFGDFSTPFDEVAVLADGVIDQQALKMYAYQAMYELTVIGKQFSRQFFNTTSRKLYSYYEGCSEGGREGWSQIQHYGSEFDGLVTGAPAFRYSHQQIQHLWSNAVEQRMGYYPPICEMEMIMKETIAACDPLDGKIDGVVSRSELCGSHFDINSTIGKSYCCPAQKRRIPATNPTFVDLPVQNGTITSEAVALARQILGGARNEQGKRLYFSYQPSASFMDAITRFDNVTRSYGMQTSGLGGAFVARLLFFRNDSVLENLDGITYDTLQGWIIRGWDLYADTLQTDEPDLTPFHRAGGKILHYHGESDDSIPAASSVRYWEAVRSVMYPHQTYNDSVAALNDWYRLFLIPGAAHCNWNSEFQANGPWPQTKFSVLIDWVEKGIVPVTLNATYVGGREEGQNTQICGWPLRPLWTENGTKMNCVYDQTSINNWQYDLDAYDEPVY